MINIKKMSFDNRVKLNRISSATCLISLVALIILYFKYSLNMVDLINEKKFTNEIIIQSTNDFFIISAYILVLFLITATLKSMTFKKLERDSENGKHPLKYIEYYDFFQKHSVIKKNIIESTRKISKENKNKILTSNNKKLVENYKIIMEAINVENKKLLEDKKELERKVKSIDEKLNNKIKIINQ